MDSNPSITLATAKYADRQLTDDDYDSVWWSMATSTHHSGT